jgi:hypothetical protein
MLKDPWGPGRRRPKQSRTTCYAADASEAIESRYEEPGVNVKHMYRFQLSARRRHRHASLHRKRGKKGSARSCRRTRQRRFTWRFSGRLVPTSTHSLGLLRVHRVRELSDARHKFKVDVNAQQYNISGVVLSAGGAAQNIYMVCAEGGPKGIRRFVKLMSRRIDWNKKVSDEKQDEEDGEEDVSDDDDDAVASTGAKTGSSGPNRCDLLWQGIVHRRAFHSFKFQECRTAASARKVCAAKKHAASSDSSCSLWSRRV